MSSLSIVEALERAGAKRIYHWDYGGMAFAYLEVPGFGQTPLEFLRYGEEPKS